MKIFVVKSSPHEHSSSNLLAGHFIRGAKEKGHDITEFDAAHGNLHPCIGCDACGMPGPCCQKDDMEGVREAVLTSNMMVFVTPLYYFGMSAQLKILIDRFYSFNGELMAKQMKTALIVAAWDSGEWTMKEIEGHYMTLCRYLRFSNQEMILGTGCGTPSMTSKTRFPQQAYEFGKRIGM